MTIALLLVSEYNALLQGRALIFCTDPQLKVPVLMPPHISGSPLSLKDQNI